MRRPAPSPLARHWALDPGIVFLNHGSFGACPTRVLDAQREHRARMEAEPVGFFCDELFGWLDRSRRAVAELIGGEPEDFVFTGNATTAVATVLENMTAGVGLGDGRPLGPGDEILAGSTEYQACLANAGRTAERTGATLRTLPVPVCDGTPMTPDRYRELVLGAVTDRTRVCLLSHIISPTGWVTPGAELVRELEGRGVTTILDGAHGPGAIGIDLGEIRPAFYTTNSHKWLCSPKGSAILYVRPDLQSRFRPQTLSIYTRAPEGALGRSRYNLEFDYVGTNDYTAALSIADAIEALPEIAGMAWPEIVRRNRGLAIEARDLLCERLGTEPASSDDMIGPMAMVELPALPEPHRERLAARPTIYADALQDALLANHGIQIPVWRPANAAQHGVSDGRRYIRLSAQLYNTIEQYEYLADALVLELERELA